MSNTRRKKEIEIVREEGRVAALTGKNKETNPYSAHCMNRIQWLRGFNEVAFAYDYVGEPE